jgi:hypothetical protein
MTALEGAAIEKTRYTIAAQQSLKPESFGYSVFSSMAFSVFSMASSTCFPAFSIGPSFSQAASPVIKPAASKDRMLRFKIDMATLPFPYWKQGNDKKTTDKVILS